MCNGHYKADYLISDQCLPRPEHKHVESYSLHFYNKKGFACDKNGLIICFPSQLDGKNRQNGIHSTIQYRILNSPNNIIASKCETHRKRFCQNEKKIKNKLNLCKEGGPADSPWHGIQIKTDETNNNSIILSLSVTNKMYLK